MSKEATTNRLGDNPTDTRDPLHDRMRGILDALLAFRDARDWRQFHTPRQLAAALAIEAGELQQAMLWKTDAEVEAGLTDGTLKGELGDEIADVLSFALLLAHDLGLAVLPSEHGGGIRNRLGFARIPLAHQAIDREIIDSNLRSPP
jgi:NTP pyrophosphatase (non-canonical NTP hydrolase)